MSTDGRPAALSLTDAATACDVARRTLTRALDAGKFPGAWRADGRQGPGTGPWMVPAVELMNAGYMPKVSPPDAPTPVSTAGAPETDSTAVELEHLKSRLLDAEHRAELAEALAAERERALDDLRTALRVLEAAKPAPATRDISMHPLRVEKPRARRRWWRRNDPR